MGAAAQEAFSSAVRSTLHMLGALYQENRNAVSRIANTPAELVAPLSILSSARLTTRHAP
jgi:hypothetical protein